MSSLPSNLKSKRSIVMGIVTILLLNYYIFFHQNIISTTTDINRLRTGGGANIIHKIGVGGGVEEMKEQHQQEQQRAQLPTENHLNPYLPWDERVADARRMKANESGGEKLGTSEIDSIYARLNYQPLNILTLGGSVAWGGYIQNRYDAFPFLIANLHPNSRVDNLAIRATGATYPAACIQSMLEGDGAFPEYDNAPGVGVVGTSSSRQNESNPHNRDESDGSSKNDLLPGEDGRVDDFLLMGGEGPPMKEESFANNKSKSNAIYYDVIFLEFSVNGVTSTDFLISRLKRRYPDALIIYIHLESLAHPPDPHLNSEYFTEMMTKPAVNGLFFMFPKEHNYQKIIKRNKESDNIVGQGQEQKGRRQGVQHPNAMPEFVDLYADDKHHLSEVGHKLVADEIMEILFRHLSQNPNDSPMLLPNKRPRLGTWGWGDQCYMWLSSWGYFPKSVEVSGGGKFAIFDTLKKKYSYEVEYGTETTFSFERKSFGGRSIPLHLVYMTLGNPPLYPKATVTIFHKDDDNKASELVVDPETDPMFPEWGWAHLTRPEVVGNTKPGENGFRIKPVNKTQNPFRLVGIIICGACEEDESSLNTNNLRIRVPN